jgi:16S rRNA (cytosine1402-N4)-methyltransferase
MSCASFNRDPRTFKRIAVASPTVSTVPCTRSNASLERAVAFLASGGRLCVISFHSLEDRIVKQFFNKLTTIDVPSKIPLQVLPVTDYELVNKKVITSQEEELESNPRAHSAKLRAIRKR